MGIRNRERRAAKAKQRARRSSGERKFGGPECGRPGYGGLGHGRPEYGESVFGGPEYGGSVFGGRAFGGPPRPPTAAELAGTVLAVAEEQARGDATAAPVLASTLLNGPLARVPGLVARAIGLAALDGMTHSWHLGWQPADLWQLIRRRLPSAESYLVDLLAADASRHSASALAPAWSAQLRRLDARVWWRADRPHLDQWTERHGVTTADAVILVVGLLAVLRTLPRMSELIPPPGSPAARGTGGSGASAPDDVDPKVLAKVRALLAKAESTEFAEEADAFFGKAQELMSRYALERAMLDADSGGSGAGPGGRRIWLDAPYVSAKSLLITEVASANRSRTVFHEALGCVTVLGNEVDLELVEVLSTSLLVHASQAMVAAGRHLNQRGQSRTKSFRQSFLVSYAARIGERLTAADAAVSEQVAGELGDDRLLPVLAARNQQVEELFESLFPSLISRRVSASNAAGWGAGRVAADQANLDVRRAVRR